MHLLRWLLPLPEPLPLPDGWTLTERVADQPDQYGQPDDPVVTVVVHQVMSAAASNISTFAAVHEVAGRISGLPKPVPGTGGRCLRCRPPLRSLRQSRLLNRRILLRRSTTRATYHRAPTA